MQVDHLTHAWALRAVTRAEKAHRCLRGGTRMSADQASRHTYGEPAGTLPGRLA